MQHHLLRHIVVIATLFICLKAHAFLTFPIPLEKTPSIDSINQEGQIHNEQNLEKQDEKFSSKNVNRIFATVQVSRDHSISPLRLCHNGLHLFFRNKKMCRDFGIPGFNCNINAEIAPLRSSEEIYLKKGGENFITRFYHIDTRYHYQEVDADTGVLLKNEWRRVPYCENRKRYVTENVRTKRVVRNQNEKIFVASLIDQSKKTKDGSFLLINSPIGNIDTTGMENLTGDVVEEDLNYTLARFPVKTPFCSGFNPAHVWQMSGEYTGGGSRDLKPASLQIISQPMFIKKKIFVVDEETGKLEHRYVFTCEPVWEI